MPPPSAHARPAALPHPLARWAGPLGCAAVLLGGFAWLATRGLDEETPPLVSLATAVWMLLSAGGLAAVYLAGAVGVGRLALRVIGPTPSRLWIQAAVGLGVMLSLSHLLGVAGLLAGGTGLYVGWGVVLVGILLLTDQVVRGGFHPEHWPVLPGWGVLAAPPAVIMLVAATSPPGVLWASEHGGFDVLSYHLQLPKEWLGLGSIRPLEHNVYSFLPNLMESAFMHLGAMAQVLEGPAAVRGGTALIAGEGTAVIAAQMLHALVGVLGAALIGRVAWTLLTRAGVEERTARFAGVLGGATALATPWVIVVGSMAYNELAVLALGAGAMLAAVETGVRPVRRAVLSGLLVGFACGAKPTAAFTVGPLAGFLLLGMLSKDERPATRAGVAMLWGRMAGWGALAGLLPMLPWLLRNAAAGGNPVFPFATGLFGRAHWSAEQVARYSAAHRFDGGVVERVALLFSATRGAAHPQWSVLFLAGVAGLIAALAWRPVRRTSALLLAGTGAMLVAWLLLTHLQSRFLLPAAAPLAIGVALGAAALATAVTRLGRTTEQHRPSLGWIARVICAGLPVGLAGHSLNLFLSENGGRPNEAVAVGVGGITALMYEGQIAFLPPSEQAAFFDRTGSPAQFMNLALDPEAKVYLLGDSTPLYFRNPVLYHTTWDSSPLAEALKAHPGRAESPAGAAWTRRFREMGVRYVLLNDGELERLIEKDGWYDPIVTRPLVGAWVGRSMELVRQWPRQRQFLLQLREPPADAPAHGTEGGER